MLVIARVQGLLTLRKFRISSPLRTVSGFFFLCIDQMTFRGCAIPGWQLVPNSNSLTDALRRPALLDSVVANTAPNWSKVSVQFAVCADSEVVRVCRSIRGYERDPHSSLGAQIGLHRISEVVEIVLRAARISAPTLCLLEMHLCGY